MLERRSWGQRRWRDGDINPLGLDTIFLAFFSNSHSLAVATAQNNGITLPTYNIVAPVGLLSYELYIIDWNLSDKLRGY